LKDGLLAVAYQPFTPLEVARDKTGNKRNQQ
jgi:hypothetical protein